MEQNYDTVTVCIRNLCCTGYSPLLFIYYATCAAINKVQYAFTKTKITENTKNCITNYDKYTLHANVAQVARLMLVTEENGSFIKYL